MVWRYNITFTVLILDNYLFRKLSSQGACIMNERAQFWSYRTKLLPVSLCHNGDFLGILIALTQPYSSSNQGRNLLLHSNDVNTWRSYDDVMCGCYGVVRGGHFCNDVFMDGGNGKS